MSYEPFFDELADTRFALNNGSGTMPAVGFGTLFEDPGVTTEAVSHALLSGFRHFDCAERFRNEEQVGVALQAFMEAGKARREDLFITSKLWNNNHHPERVLPAFEASRQRLGVDYLDCYLIHTPFAFQAGDDQDPRDVFGHILYDSGVTLIDTWRAMERLVDKGRCKSIGLSNINLQALQEVVAVARIKPAVVQVEAHPYLPEWELLEFCQQHGIILQAFSPLGHGLEPSVLKDSVLTQMARRLQKTPAQVALAWAVQRGTAFLTTSASLSHIQQNTDISTLPHRAMHEIRQDITTRVRFNSVAETGVHLFMSPTR
ncbi:aldo/keto reductase [Pseudomonas sp. PCH199]|uniref:aldo/keto reductase n=1 Tax=unclassified Pseudomonas TaxID=196821 RepID=UPI000BC834F5|nr:MULTISPECIES: aldo/keto reductase [unclassified Pseudomonas]MCW8278119.1 aldo/keto reductase [Pseudomonas sp. PCH199]PAM81602.1 dehydrogenase [Pseudomonas sp. ERMR1:02]